MLDLLCLFYALRQRLQAVHANDRDGDAGTLMERRAARPISVAQTPDSQAAYCKRPTDSGNDELPEIHLYCWVEQSGLSDKRDSEICIS